MKDTFAAYFPELLKHEGGYVDHPSDPGGATNMGITIATLREWRGKAVTKQDVKRLTRTEAMAIYRARYWNVIDGDNLRLGVDALAFDIAVNHGVGRWRQWEAIAQELPAYMAVKAICDRRRKFYRSLKTFPTFGTGWMRRANEVEAWAMAKASDQIAQRVVDTSPVVVIKNTPISPDSRTAQGATVSATGVGITQTSQTLAETVESTIGALAPASSLPAVQTIVAILTVIGVCLSLGGLAYVFYARWDGGGRKWSWSKP